LIEFIFVVANEPLATRNKGVYKVCIEGVAAMPINRTVRYAAKQAYQLMLMRGISESTQCGLHCQVFPSIASAMFPNGLVRIGENEVPIAKSWANL
jgi:hypothetical protein